MAHSPAPLQRGARELRRLLRDQIFDLRHLDAAGFCGWLDRQLAHWQRDPVFMQRCRIRDLRRLHPNLQILEKEQHQAADLDAASPSFSRLRWLEKELRDMSKAIAGLGAASKRAAAERRPSLQHKLTAFQAQRRALELEQTQLIQSSPTRQALLEIASRLQQLRSDSGLDRAEACLQRLLNQRGHRSGRSGGAFEKRALALTATCIVPDLLRSNQSPAASERLRVLHGITLGAADIELDQLVIREPRRPQQAVEVLAVVEVKRNINDLAHGFRRRQADLAWLTGEVGQYDPQRYRTRHFRSGHFDREAIHQEAGEAFRFTRDSFRRFQRDATTGLFLDRLYFITRTGMMWGLSSAALSRLQFRVATEERWQLDRASDLRAIRRWCLSLTQSVESPDVLRLYLSTPRRARAILVVSR